jgi:hypothetical protein
MAIARELRVPGLVLVHLEKTGAIDRLPAAIADDLRLTLRQARRRTAQLELERDRIVTLLGREGLAPIVLKGSGLASMLYAEPVERQMADIDVLVGAADVDKAIDVMLRARYQPPPEAAARAYRRQHFHLRFVHPFNYVVEIHWALDEPNRDFHLSADGFFRETIEVQRPGRPSLRLPRHELGLLHLVAQNVQERFRWFNRLVDIDRFVARTTLDWTYLEQQATAAGLLVPLALSCELTAKLLGTVFPHEILARIAPTRIARAHLAMLQPAAQIVDPMKPRRSAADRLLDLWLLPASASKVTALARLLTADGWVDPRHVELGRLERPGRLRRVVSLAKLLGYQLTLYGRAMTFFADR